MEQPTTGQNWQEGAAYMHDAYMPIGEAKIGVTDWGFTHSDIAYDVVHVWDGAFFRLDDHLDRFLASAEKLRLEFRESRTEIAEILNNIVARAGFRSSYVTFVASRGTPRIQGGRDPRDCINHFFAWCVPFIWVITPEMAERGARLMIAKDTRRIAADSVDPTVKNYHWGDFTRGLFEAKDAGFDSVILLDHAGNVTEGPGFNVFAVKGGTVITPDRGTLRGISQRTVLELAEEEGLKTEVRPLPIEEFYQADEVFLSTTGGGVRPVVAIDERVYGNGQNGEIATRLFKRYWQWHDEGRYSTAVDYELAEIVGVGA